MKKSGSMIGKVFIVCLSMMSAHAFAMGRAPVGQVQEAQEALENVVVPAPLQLKDTSNKDVVLDQSKVAGGVSVTLRQNLIGGDDLLLKAGDIHVSFGLGSSLPFEGHDIPQNLDGLVASPQTTRENVTVTLARLSATPDSCQDYSEVVSCQVEENHTRCRRDAKGKENCDTETRFIPGHQQHDYTLCSRDETYSLKLTNVSGVLALSGEFSNFDSWRPRDVTSPCMRDDYSRY